MPPDWNCKINLAITTTTPNNIAVVVFTQKSNKKAENCLINYIYPSN